MTRSISSSLPRSLMTLRLPLLSVICITLLGCTSISCRYGTPTATDKTPSDLPIGNTLQTTMPLVGLLDESIDDPSTHYLNIVMPPGYQNRFVKQRVVIPAGTKFRIIGYRRPFSPLCRSHDWAVILESETRFAPDRIEIHMKLTLARQLTRF